MKLQKFILAMVVIFITATSCKKNVIEPEPDTPPKPKVELKNPINDFTWKAMNSWYNWQEKVPNLADSKANNVDSYKTYLNNYSTPKELFSSLLYNYGSTDRFSWFIPDYVEQQKSFQGISTTTGIRRSDPIIALENQVIIYAAHISKNSPADKAGMKRGDIIFAIDNEEMDRNNYRRIINKLYSGKTIVVSTAKFENEKLKKLKDYTITPAEVADNPVFLTKVFDNVNGKKVGYLVYNGFRSSYNDELNDAFATLKNAGIDELILDLRINGGGSVRTSAYLASMIHSEANTDGFAELRFNKKHSNENGTYSFSNTLNVYDNKGNKTGTQNINRISGLNKLYVLTSRNTASASEMIINGLSPFIDIIKIGTKTYGKNVGSITLYDSPETGYINPEYVPKSNPKRQTLINKLKNKPHKNAMQPIVFQIYNKNGESDYTNGFEPNIMVEEWRSWKKIFAFGDENETLLKTALNEIKGVASRPIYTDYTASFLSEEGIKKVQFENEMYIEGDFFNN